MGGTHIIKGLAVGFAALVAVLVSPALAADEQKGPAWEKLPTIPYTLNNKQDAIAFANERTGWYGNGTGRLYKTNDGGTNWTQVWSRRGTYIRALEFVDDKVGFLGNVGPAYFPNVSDRQPLYVTRDGGATWAAVNPDGGRRIVGICAIDVLRVPGKPATIRAGGRVGGPAGLMESYDGGATWRARDMSKITGMILDIKFVDAETGFIAGASEAAEENARARILKTSDGGRNWRTVFDSGRAGDNNWKLAFPTAKVGYGTIISYQAPDDEARGYVVKSDDGGETWKRQTVTTDRQWIPYGIAFIDEQHGFVGGSTGGFETNDGGATWRPSDMGASVNKFRFVPREGGGITAYAIGQEVRKLEVK